MNIYKYIYIYILPDEAIKQQSATVVKEDELWELLSWSFRETRKDIPVYT
jgi:hypothetical protein